MQIDTDKMAQQCIDAINDKIKNLKKLNIIVVGKSGVGKSTLINSLFRRNFAETGLGRPATSEIRKKKRIILLQFLIRLDLNFQMNSKITLRKKSLILSARDLHQRI
ncbi:GTPase RsgA [Terrisporobacter mayombei]|uniref:GTPase RsgA n=1 Tax=Terrisporobacter mayombei TaxID=1541 RepID=UPI00265A00CE|nr:GTPase RsgA [Terrisporobacter mayombei]MCC3668899.1 50S ribosome-binding GTPase [Terrisporobacter mayombei]